MQLRYYSNFSVHHSPQKSRQRHLQRCLPHSVSPCSITPSWVLQTLPDHGVARMDQASCEGCHGYGLSGWPWSCLWAPFLLQQTFRKTASCCCVPCMEQLWLARDNSSILQSVLHSRSYEVGAERRSVSLRGAICMNGNQNQYNDC